jgi:glycosyltransferase involved in cell wall biosynthesis
MRVSIALASYNGAAFIAEQLDSFAGQSRLPDEVIVSDDRSGDGTRDIVAAFAARAPFTLRLVVNESRPGLVGNFSNALEHATGDLVFLSDQDDVWAPGKIARMTALAQAYPDALCLMNDAWLADGALVASGRTKLGEIRAAGLPESAFVMGCCAALRRELLDFALPIPSLMRAHDNWLVGIADQAGRVHRVAEPLQYYRLHGGNTSDFFVNRPRVPSRGARLLHRVQRMLARFSSTSGFEGEYRFHAALDARLAAWPDFGTPGMRAAVAARLAVLSQRWDIRTRPRLRRVGPAFALWRQGGYESGLGPVKDVILPGQPPRPVGQAGGCGER